MYIFIKLIVKIKSLFTPKTEEMHEELEITQEIFDRFLKFTSELQQQSQDAFGFFSTKTRHAVGYSDPIKRKEVQEKLDHAVGLLAVAHVMALFEDSFPQEYWTDIIDDDSNYKTLMAYRHVRHCAANGFTGKRPDEDHEFFDEIMNSESPLRGVDSFESDELFLEESVGNYAHTFLSGLMNKIIVELHKRVNQ